MFRGLDFLGVFFVEIAELLDLRVLENGVAVKGHLCVERHEVATVGGDEGVDLNEHGVVFPVELVKSG